MKRPDVCVNSQADLIRFGDFELDVGAYRLRRAGRDVRLEQQPMDLLILLVQRRPQLVSREEIVERLWGTETFVEAEAGINTAVRKVRQSRDAKWIYVSSARGGARDIWRADVETGRMEQITHGGSGFWSAEAPDRTGVLYAQSNADSPLLFQAHSGGAPREIRPCVAAGSIAVAGEHGIYYLPCAKEGVVLDQPVHHFDPATGIDRRLGLLEGYRRPRDVFPPSFRKMAVSRDGRTILYTRRLPAMADLMLIENLR